MQFHFVGRQCPPYAFITTASIRAKVTGTKHALRTNAFGQGGEYLERVASQHHQRQSCIS